ncbi:MAG: hypothetical protein PUP90_11520 [Nostoc sp. S4]|nr:hypothetical protein [Nostoc sp. S4]
MTKRCRTSLPPLALQRHDGNRQPMPQNSTSLKHITKPVDVDALIGIIVQLAQPH